MVQLLWRRQALRGSNTDFRSMIIAIGNTIETMESLKLGWLIAIEKKIMKMIYFI